MIASLASLSRGQNFPLPSKRAIIGKDKETAQQGGPIAPFLSVIVPAYNEEKRLPSTLPQVLDYLQGQGYSWEVIVVDDGSSDGTAAVVKALAASQPGLRLVSAPHRGKGHAVKTGMLAAQGEYRFLCDADLSMPISHLARFLPPQLEGYHIAIGSREAPGARRLGEPATRHLLSHLFNLAVRLLAVPGLRDTQCGFKCFRAEAAQALFPLQRIAGFGFDVEVLYLAQRRGMQVLEVPIDWHHRPGSKVRLWRDGLAILWEALMVRWDYWQSRYTKV